jgi:hypothetical protein
MMDDTFCEFTEEGYRELVRLAKERYRFIGFEDYRTEGKVVLWRHDIDLSPHRALALAKIEAREGVSATYFLNLHQEFYNALEREVRDIIREILAMGHALGLHFDPLFYNLALPDEQGLINALTLERQMLERIYHEPVRVFSLHNPDVEGSLIIDDDEIAGMINTYSQYFKKHYGYCSDSNGYWRFRPLRAVLMEAQEERLQVLTHAGWWTPETMSPRERITRCIEGRAKKQHRAYDEALKSFGRENIGERR